MFSTYKREIIAGVSGGLVFSAVYVFGGQLVISLVCGIAVFLLAYLLWRRDNEIMEVTVSGSKQGDYTEMIRSSLERLAAQRREARDETVRNHLAGIIETGAKIAAEGGKLSASPGELKICKDLATYYLPSLCGVMDKYTTIVKNNISSDSANAFKHKVSIFLAEMNAAFERQLDALLSDDITDASLEMDVVKNILKSDGFMEQS